MSTSKEEYPPLNIRCGLTLNVTREDLGREVRRVWVEWAKEQPNPKAHWLDDYDSTTPEQREVDCRIGEAVAKLVMTNLSDDDC